MSVEAEQKARVRDPDAVEKSLARYGKLRRSTYRDTYFDSSDGALVARNHELRVRVIEADDNATALLTVKGSVLDQASGSKQETETTIGDAESTKTVLEQLGYRTYVELTKQCVNVDLEVHGYAMLATLVTVPELDGTFVELETVIADDADLQAALDAVHATLADLGIPESDYTSETYTGAVLAARDRD